MFVCGVITTGCAVRLHYWKERCLVSEESYGDLMNRALRAEASEATSKDEMQRWQAMLVSIQSRPVIAALTNEQAGALITAVQMCMRDNLHGVN